MTDKIDRDAMIVSGEWKELVSQVARYERMPGETQSQLRCRIMRDLMPNRDRNRRKRERKRGRR